MEFVPVAPIQRPRFWQEQMRRSIESDMDHDLYWIADIATIKWPVAANPASAPTIAVPTVEWSDETIVDERQTLVMVAR